MGCGLSSHSHVVDKGPVKAVRQGVPVRGEVAVPDIAQNKTHDQEFHQFVRLPFELRRQIWIECLSQESPRAYSIDLYVTLVDPPPEERVSQYIWDKRPIKVDFALPNGLRGAERLRDLVTATAASRILGSTCREARDAVAFVLPDTCQFKMDHWPWRFPTSTGYFRFNAKQDIFILLSMSTIKLRQILKWTSTGAILDTFQTLQRLAMDVTFMEDTLLPTIWNKCRCGGKDCATCSRDPLPDFLGLFPCLKSFHLAQATTSFIPEEPYEEPRLYPVRPCGCSPKHDWPLFRAMAHGAWYISYMENSGCPYSTLPQLDCDREHGPGWPYYNALRDLDIRILRRVILPGAE